MDSIKNNILKKMISEYHFCASFFYRNDESKVRNSYNDIVFCPALSIFCFREIKEIRKKECDSQLDPCGSNFVDCLDSEEQDKVINHLEKVIPIFKFANKTNSSESELWKLLKENNLLGIETVSTLTFS